MTITKPITSCIEISVARCTIISSCEFIEIVSVGERENDDGIRVYPNPTNSLVYIKLAANSYRSSIILATIEGVELRNVVVRNGDQAQLNIADLSPGVYILSIQFDQDQRSFKVLKY